MKIAVIGASAGIGLETVKRALERQHEVTALSRSIMEISENPLLRSITGDALHKNDLARAMHGADAVIVTLGTRKNMKQTTLFSDFAKLLIEIQKESKSKAIHLIVTGFGTGESAKYVGWFIKLFLKYILKDVYADKAKMEQLISESDLHWLIVRPGRLLDEPKTENYRIETSLYKGINIGAINRSDVADYLVKQAEQPSDLLKFSAISQK
jgi:putative NADH-flavin reductase